MVGFVMTELNFCRCCLHESLHKSVSLRFELQMENYRYPPVRLCLFQSTIKVDKHPVVGVLTVNVSMSSIKHATMNTLLPRNRYIQLQVYIIICFICAWKISILIYRMMKIINICLQYNMIIHLSKYIHIRFESRCVIMEVYVTMFHL